MTERLKSKLENFSRTLRRFEEALQASPDNPFYIEIRTKCLELAFETAWKATRATLHDQGLSNPAFPRESLRVAYKAGLIDDETEWIAMLEDRNSIVHIYKEEWALAVCKRMEGYLPLLQDLEQKLRELYG